MGDAHLELRNLSKSFGDDMAVDDVSLNIARGKFTCLLGPSGCGKTTTLRMIAGFIEPDSGDVLIGGRSQGGLLANNRPTSIVFQDYALFPHMTVKNNVAYGLRARKLAKGEVERRTQEALELMGLDHLTDRYPGQLSGGQQQRVALGRSVAVEPEVLLMDEPLSNLDAKLRVRLRTDLRELQQRLGITTVYVTHDREEALAMGDEIAVMSKGKLEQLGAPRELYDRPQTPFVADFMGLNNFIPCEIISSGIESTQVRVAQVHTLDVDTARVSGDDFEIGELAALVVRPESLEAHFEFPESFDGLLLECTLIGSQFLGSLTRNWVNFEGAEVVVDEHSPSPRDEPKSGTTVWLRLPEGRPILMKGGAEKVMRHGSLQ